MWVAEHTLKTTHCLVLILVQRHNWAIFLRKWAWRGSYSQWRSLSGHVERIFFTKIEEEDIGNIWFQQDGATCRTAETALDILRPTFKDHIISRRADVVCPSQTWDLKPLEYYLWGAVKDKCCVDKPETIYALKDNIRKAIGEIQLHTIDNVLKNWRPRQPFEWSYFPLLTGRIVLSNKKAAELTTFGHLKAAIWHRWTIICGVPSKISFMPSDQRKFML